MTLQDQIDVFVAYVQNMMNAHHKDHPEFTPKMESEPGQKWARVWRVPPGEVGRSAYAFIALVDFSNRDLGQVTAGDIYMPASYKAPAKHRRGTVLDPNTWTCAGPYGVARLK
jgi:hypothetical protein